MKRVRINSYNISKSARLLSHYLGVKRLKKYNSKFVVREGDVVINWGNGKGRIGRARQINKLSNVQLASNKLSTFNTMSDNNISTPEFSESLLDFSSDDVLFARTTLYGHSGKGIVVDTQENLYSAEVVAPLYVKKIDKKREYRVIVCNGEAVDKKEKLKKRDWEGDRSEYVWNHSNGYVFARNGIDFPDDIGNLAVSAVSALGLDFGAADIIEDEEGVLYVLEINTAFGIEGTTLELFGDKLKEML